MIDYDYIMRLITRYSQSSPQKQKMTREELIGLLSATANFMDDREEMIAYINTLKVGEGLSEKAIREGYETLKLKGSQDNWRKLNKSMVWKHKTCKPLWITFIIKSRRANFSIASTVVSSASVEYKYASSSWSI